MQSNDFIFGGYDQSTPPPPPAINSDGALTVSGNFNIDVTNSNPTDRSGADGAVFNVTSFLYSTGVILNSSAAGILAPGDQVLLLNMQGWQSGSGMYYKSGLTNVGNQEVLTVASVSGTQVNFTAPKVNQYGDSAGSDTNVGTSTSNQRVILKRVPKYSSVTINNGGTITANTQNGTYGGVVAFTCNGSVTIASGAMISVLGLGYRGGATTSSTGYTGECYTGLGAANNSNNVGGGGGGALNNGYGGDGGGASYGTDGTAGVQGNQGGTGGAGGPAGTTYGVQSLGQIFLGSGGGAGGGSNVPSAGASGGGIIMIWAASLNLNGGQIYASGANASGATNMYGGTGGSGSGGSIYLNISGNIAVVFGSRVLGLGGVYTDSHSKNHGQGGMGRTAVNYGSTSGSLFYCDPYQYFF